MAKKKGKAKGSTRGRSSGKKSAGKAKDLGAKGAKNPRGGGDPLSYVKTSGRLDPLTPRADIRIGPVVPGTS